MAKKDRISGRECLLLMIVPHPGARWADPQLQAQRRAEIERQQRELGEFYQQQTEAQEERQNAEARERFGLRS